MDTNHWTEIKFDEKVNTPKARKFASSFKHQNKMYVVGGCENKYACIADGYYMDFSQYLQTEDIKDLEWKKMEMTNSELIKRWGHSSQVSNNKAYIFGGRCGNKDLQNFIQIDL